MDQRGASLDVAQEVVTEAPALGGTLDQTRHVGDGERRLAGGDHAEVGDEGGEGVVGDLGPRPRDRRDDRRLAGAREADEADVGDDLELEAYVELVTGLPQQREAGCLALRRGQRGVAETAPAAAGDHHRRAGTDEVGEHVALAVLDQGAAGHGQDEVLAVGAVAVRAGAMTAVLGLATRAVVVVHQRGDVGVDLEDDRPAGTAVAAVRTTERLELLAVHRGHAVATAPRSDVQRHVVDECGERHGDNLCGSDEQMKCR